MSLRTRNLLLAVLSLATIVGANGCILHRNLLLRWHLEFDANNIPDEHVPDCVDCNCSRCQRLSKLGAAGCIAKKRCEERGPAAGPTPAQLGLARFHPLPTKPVFNVAEESATASNEPPAPSSPSLRMSDPEHGPLSPEEMRNLEEIEGVPEDAPRESRRLRR